MHELSLARSIIDIIEEYATRHDFKRVNIIALTCGRLSCVEHSCLEFAFKLQARDTPADGAALNLRLLPVVIYCVSCKQQFEVDLYPSLCPQCEHGDIVLRGGTEELKVVELDVD